MRAGEVQLGLQFVKAQKRADGNGHTQIPAPKTARHALRSLRALRELTRAEFAALPKVNIVGISQSCMVISTNSRARIGEAAHRGGEGRQGCEERARLYAAPEHPKGSGSR